MSLPIGRLICIFLVPLYIFFLFPYFPHSCSLVKNSMRICNTCHTIETKKWYRDAEGWLCQSHYRKKQYQLKKEYICQRERDKYQRFGRPQKDTSKVCHQKIVRDARLKSDLKRLGKEFLKFPLEKYVLSPEKYSREHREFIETYEWLGNVGNSPKWVYTARVKEQLAGVIMLNEPNSYSSILPNTKVTEAIIQRGACASWAHKHLASKLIMFSIKDMVKNTSKRLFVAYSDPEANEIGTVYQACNFKYLGGNFGSKIRYIHPKIKNGKPFSIQSLRRTSSLKKWLKEEKGLSWNKEWEKENGYKDLAKFPAELKDEWYAWVKKIAEESEKESIEPKGKYALIAAPNKKEHRKLMKEVNWKTYPYPKR